MNWIYSQTILSFTNFYPVRELYFATFLILSEFTAFSVCSILLCKILSVSLSKYQCHLLKGVVTKPGPPVG